MSKKDVWKKTMGEVQDFVKKNNKKPYEKSKDITEKRLGQWLSAQIRNHKTKSESMKIQEIYDTYTEFIGKHQKIFMKNEEIWMENLSEVQQFIEKTNKRPSSTSKDIVEKQLGTWLLRQKTNYKLKSKLMSTKKIYDLYTTFINDSRYKNFFN
jgi:glutamate synthase domain-containing protein 3